MAVSAQIILISLVALFVGAMIPVMVSFSFTLRHLRKAINATEKKMSKVFDQTSEVLIHVNHFAREVSQSSSSVKSISKSIENFSQMLEGLGKGMKVMSAIGAAIAPTLVAGVQSFKKSMPKEPAEFTEREERESPTFHESREGTKRQKRSPIDERNLYAIKKEE